MVVLGGSAVSYARGTPVERTRAWPRHFSTSRIFLENIIETPDAPPPAQPAMSLKYEPASEPLHISRSCTRPSSRRRTQTCPTCGCSRRPSGGSRAAATSPRLQQEGRCKATWKRGLTLPWREAGPPNHQDDKVVSDQWVVNKELSLRSGSRAAGTSPRLHVTERGGYRGTPPIRNRAPLEPCSRTMPRAPGWS